MSNKTTAESKPIEDAAAEDRLLLDTQYRIRIPGDTVKTALARLRESGEIDEEGERAVWWFYTYAREHNWRLQDAAEAIGKDKTTVHRLFNGSYGASYTGLLEEIAKFKTYADERSKRTRIGFVETSTWRKVDGACRQALYDGMPAFVYGASQIGKTACLKEYARRNNHGQTRYVRMPAAPGFASFVRALADACWVSTVRNIEYIRPKILDAIDSRTLLIIDEVHECMVTSTDLVARKIVEYIREVYDRTECGIVICGTKVLKSEFERGRQALLFDQLRRRGFVEVLLPDRPPVSDVNAIARAFDLPAPSGSCLDTIKSMLQESGIGKYIKFLQYAASLSAARKEQLSWEHFTQAYDGIRSLANG
jgi:DNA transposition AAA+ family ATPase